MAFAHWTGLYRASGLWTAHVPQLRPVGALQSLLKRPLTVPPANEQKATDAAKKTGSPDSQSYTSDMLPFVSRPHIDSASLPPEVIFTFVRNNTFVTVARPPGHTLARLSAGTVGCRNAQKTEPKAALALVDALKARMQDLALGGSDGRSAFTIRVNLRGLNAARAIIVGQLRRAGFQITEILDTTGVPHNGCRPKKPRRL